MSKGFLESFLTVFGDIKVFSWPMFVVYDPGGYALKGGESREVMQTVQPGDILVRGYDSYLDGYFIPGYFSHVGLYVGEVTEADRTHAPQDDHGRFATGKQMVVHSMAEGVFMEDVLQFCRCDRMLVLRFPETLRKRVDWKPWAEKPAMEPGELEVFDALTSGQAVRFADAFKKAIFPTALSKVGAEYDFRFDFKDFTTLSCSELVYFATRCLGPYLGIEPQAKRLLWASKRLIAPDAFVSAPLELAWKSRKVDAAKLAALRPPPASAAQAA